MWRKLEARQNTAKHISLQELNSDMPQPFEHNFTRGCPKTSHNCIPDICFWRRQLSKWFELVYAKIYEQKTNQAKLG